MLDFTDKYSIKWHFLSILRRRRSERCDQFMQVTFIYTKNKKADYLSIISF